MVNCHQKISKNVENPEVIGFIPMGKLETAKINWTLQFWGHSGRL
jgi:hypothetical protein